MNDQYAKDRKILEENAISFAQEIIKDAQSKEVGSLVIEPGPNTSSVSYRNNWKLKEIATMPNAFSTKVIDRIKTLAQLHIDVRRINQDGSFKPDGSGPIKVLMRPNDYGQKLILFFDKLTS